MVNYYQTIKGTTTTKTATATDTTTTINNNTFIYLFYIIYLSAFDQTALQHNNKRVRTQWKQIWYNKYNPVKALKTKLTENKWMKYNEIR